MILKEDLGASIKKQWIKAKNTVLMQFPKQGVAASLNRPGKIDGFSSKMRICALAVALPEGPLLARVATSHKPQAISRAGSCMQMLAQNWIGQGGLRCPSYVPGPVITTHNNSKGRKIPNHNKPRGGQEGPRQAEFGVKKSDGCDPSTLWRGDRWVGLQLFLCITSCALLESSVVSCIWAISNKSIQE